MNHALVFAIFVCSISFGCWGSVPAPASPPNEDRDDDTSSESTSEPSVSPLETHAWEDRPVVVFAPDASHDAYRRQMELFDGHRDGLVERRNVVYRVFEDGSGQGPFGPLDAEDVRALRSRFAPDGEFAAVLVGLDTTEKLRVTEPLTTERLFDTIDAMPMRKREMEREE